MLDRLIGLTMGTISEEQKVDLFGTLRQMPRLRPKYLISCILLKREKTKRQKRGDK